MSLTTNDLQQIKGIVHDVVQDIVHTAVADAKTDLRQEIAASEQRLHHQIVTLGDRLDTRIDETHTRIDALRIEVNRDIHYLARTVATAVPHQT